MVEILNCYWNSHIPELYHIFYRIISSKIWKMRLTEFGVHVTVHRDKLLIIKPTRCTSISNLFLEWKSTCFRQFLCPSSGVVHCTHSNVTYSCDDSLWASCQHIPLLCVQWKTPDDGQRNCLKHAEFHSKNKFEILVHLVGFIIRKINRTWLYACYFNGDFSSEYTILNPPQKKGVEKEICYANSKWIP